MADTSVVAIDTNIKMAETRHVTSPRWRIQTVMMASAQV